MGPLQGIKVIDMTTVLMGPYATQMLGDYGADVIKVEPPDGDRSRQIGGKLFDGFNRSKRSIALDLSTGEGQANIYINIDGPSGRVGFVRINGKQAGPLYGCLNRVLRGIQFPTIKGPRTRAEFDIAM
jgi:hypothetical protein